MVFHYCFDNVVLFLFLSVDIQLISKAVTENLLLLEKLSKYLDRESRVIKCWKHLAFVLNVPIEETRKFDLYTEHSPTEDLFNFLTNIPELKVVDLREKLKAIYRNDLVETLNKGKVVPYCVFFSRNCFAF